MATWQDIAALRADHPEWGAAQIARELIALGEQTDFADLSGWVRSTFRRRGWVKSAPVKVAQQSAPSVAIGAQGTKHRALNERFDVAITPPHPVRTVLPVEIIDDKRSRRAQRYVDYTRGLD